MEDCTRDLDDQESQYEEEEEDTPEEAALDQYISSTEGPLAAEVDFIPDDVL
jgi:hypothetical protein